MGLQIIIGYSLIILSIVIQMLFIEIATRTLKSLFEYKVDWLQRLSGFIISLTGVSFWLLVSMSVVILMWASVLIILGIFTLWEESIYFSLVAFTTLGFGDITLPQNWRILSGFIAANGFLIFGLNTAVLIEVMRRLRNDP